MPTELQLCAVRLAVVAFMFTSTQIMTASLSNYFSSLVEFVTVRCRLFYLTQKCTTIFRIGVYIHPAVMLSNFVYFMGLCELQNAHSDGLFIVTRDFNHGNLE